MKLLATALLALFLFRAGDPPPELLDRKWYFTYMVADGRAMELPLKVPDDKRPWLLFSKGGAYQQAMDNVIEKGRWTYADASKKLGTTVTTRKGTTEVTAFVLQRVTKDSLELREPEGSVLGLVSK
ncbi:hypothetical protein [Flaviaesturariibacter terrae]